MSCIGEIGEHVMCFGDSCKVKQSCARKRNDYLKTLEGPRCWMCAQEIIKRIRWKYGNKWFCGIKCTNNFYRCYPIH